MKVYNDELQHYGILGMRWGKHKSRVKAYNTKVSTISKKLEKSGDNASDARRMAYASKKTGKRITEAVGGSVAKMLVQDFISGKMGSYTSMSKADVVKKTLGLVKSSTAKFAVNEALAKSAASKYDESGKQIKGKKNRLVTREDMIGMGIDIGAAVAPIAKAGLGSKARQVNRTRERNETIYRNRGGNIISDRTHSFVNGSFSVR